MRKLLLSVGLCFGLAATSAAAAQPITETGRFDVYFAGLKAGELTYAMKRENGAYAATGRVVSTGLIAAIANIHFSAKARGRIQGDRFTPTRYEESSDTGRRTSDKVIRYASGVPVLEHTDTPRDYWLDPRKQSDALDPLTAVWNALRDRSADDLCKLDVSYFDGARRIRLTTANPQRAEGKVICSGRYIRVGGYSKKAMKEGTSFPFSITYAPHEEGNFRVTRVDAKTMRGRAIMIRR